MFKILITGAGKIGSAVACMLAESDEYEIHVADVDFSGPDINRLNGKFANIRLATLDVENKKLVSDYLRQNSIEAIISSLPFFLNVEVAKIAKENGVHYFDLTEDISVTAAVAELACDSEVAFVPQCGLAPGFVSIVANSLAQNFTQLDTVKLRVGALPQHSNNALQYAMTWSTEGLINQYGNACHGIENGEAITLHALEGLEAIQIDGLSYEAFNTSGGLGSLAKSYLGKVNHLTYKTMRYPGHCEKMRVLMNDLKLNEDRGILKNILEKAIPKTYQDVVVVYVAVTGYQQDVYLEENYFKKIYPQTIAEITWSAIQITTASGVCAVVDIVLRNTEKYRGLVLQEHFQLKDFLASRFGRYYL